MNLNKIIEKVQFHYKCRNGVYPRNPHVVRFPVPDDKVAWSEIWTQYDPVSFTSDAIKNQTWADPPIDDPSFKPKWNEVDGKVNRKSHMGQYKIVNRMPLNPLGRTGVTGRGILGRWGPNHAADSILTRWKRTSNMDLERDETTKKPILQFVVIQRRDCGEWAIPGGMVDPGETVGATLRREFFEEALSAEKDRTFLEELFRKGTEIYKGYVDDPRNTDNAWMETVATNFHDDDGKYVGKLNLSAGDDAVNAKWVDINSKLKLYASHIDFIAEVAKIRNCHW